MMLIMFTAIEDDLANWHITQEAMLDIGLDRGQQQQIFQVC